MRPHIRESRRHEQRHVPRSRAVEPQQPNAPVPVHLPRGAGAASAGRVPQLRPAGQAARVRPTLYLDKLYQINISGYLLEIYKSGNNYIINP